MDHEAFCKVSNKKIRQHFLFFSPLIAIELLNSIFQSNFIISSALHHDFKMEMHMEMFLSDEKVSAAKQNKKAQKSICRGSSEHEAKTLFMNIFCSLKRLKTHKLQGKTNDTKSV
jgi:hypothetical protein